MDAKTREYYDNHGISLAHQYASADLTRLHTLLQKWLPPGGRVLEMGCGSGRDALYMASLGCWVTALDGSATMVHLTREVFSRHALDSSRIFHASVPLPMDHELLNETFHAVVAVALLMHLQNSELALLSSQIARILKEGGLFICSFSSEERRKRDERLFIQREPREVELLFRDAGCRLLFQEETADGLGRRIFWNTMVFSRVLS